MSHINQRRASRWVLQAMLMPALVALSAATWAGVAPITEQATRLAQRIDALEVEHHWPAGVHVHWESGEPDGKPEISPGKHTHCSAFVAAAAKRVGV
ncbi:MAG: hypothetical protein QM808_07290 [Steroidobacteraceae bacterium]